MTWQDLSVYQFQQLAAIWEESNDSNITDTMIATCAICYNMTEQQIDSLGLSQYKKLVAGLDFLKQDVVWNTTEFVSINGRRYRFVFDVQDIHAARYMEVKHFSGGGLIPNLHKMAACMVVPQVRKRRYWFSKAKWVDDTYDVTKHDQYSDDMLQAPITAVHGSAVFFCNVFVNSMEIIKVSLSKTMNPTLRESMDQLLAASCKILVGSTRQQSLPNTSVSLLSKHINSQLSSS